MVLFQPTLPALISKKLTKPEGEDRCCGCWEKSAAGWLGVPAAGTQSSVLLMAALPLCNLHASYCRFCKVHSGVAPPKYLVYLHSGAGVVFLLLVLRQSQDAVFETQSLFCSRLVYTFRRSTRNASI